MLKSTGKSQRMKLRRDLLKSEHMGLAWRFDVSPYSCDNPIYYKQYITLCALDDFRTGTSLTHVFIDEQSDKMAGYISLRASSLISESETGSMLVHPALEIAELAVDKGYEGKGVGREMFNFAVATADSLRMEHLGIKYIAVCADPKAVGFYKKLGFEPVGSLYKIPRDGWNEKCTPMYIALPELNMEE